MRIRAMRLFSVVVAAGISAGTATMAGGPTPASATAFPPILTCTAAGHLETVSDVGIHYVWTLTGGGTCADSSTTYTTDIVAAGTSSGLGVCDVTGVVQNLSLDVSVTMTSTTDGSVRALSEQFASPLTTYPIATPFLVAKNSKTIGAGNLDTHLFVHCPPGGTPSTFLVWTQTE